MSYNTYLQARRHVSKGPRKLKKVFTNSQTLLGILALSLSSIVGGTSYSPSKYTMQFLNPAEFLTYRFLLGSLTLSLISPSSVRKLNWEKTKLALPTAAVLSVSMLALWQGVKYSDTGLSAFLANAEFIIIPIISFFLFRQRASLQTLFLVFLGLTGMGLLSFTNGFEISTGTAYLLTCTVCFAFYAVLNTELTQKLAPYELTLLNLFLSTVICSIVAFITGFTFNIDKTVILPLLYLGSIVMGVRFYFITYGQSKVRASHAGLIYLCEPITAALIGYYSLGERLALSQLAGIALLILTVFGSFFVVSQEE